MALFHLHRAQRIINDFTLDNHFNSITNLISAKLACKLALCAVLIFSGFSVESISAQNPIIQLGQDIDGEAVSDGSGYSVSLSSDGSRLAIGARGNSDNGTASGHVRIYDWDVATSTWIQLGQDIDGQASEDFSGSSVSLSSDGSRVAIGAPYNDDNGDDSGQVRIYEWDAPSSLWVQLGSEINGEATLDYCGTSVSLSSDGSRVVIGAPYNDGYETNSGHTRIYEWDENTSEWIQLGQDIDGESGQESSTAMVGDRSGSSVSISSDGSIVAIGATHNAGVNGNGSGHTRIYEWNATDWIQLGQDIDGEFSGDASGTSVSLSSDGSRVAIGAPGNSEIANLNGHVRVYDWDSATSTWIQLGSDIDGYGMFDNNGHSVSLSSDGTRVVMGAPGFFVSLRAPFVRIFDWDATASSWIQRGCDLLGEELEYNGDAVSISADGTRAAIGVPENTGANGNNSGHVRVFDLTVPDMIADPGSYYDLDICEIVLCPPGTYCPGGTNTAIPCPAGRYQSLEGQSVCLSCLPGYFQANEGAIDCQPCLAGTSNPNSEATFCTACPAGSYSDSEAATECQSCPPGSYQGFPGAIECELCPAGTANPDIGQIECTDCPAGTSNPLEGQEECIVCQITLVCQDDFSVNVDPGTCEATGVVLNEPVVTSSCTITSIVSDAPMAFPLGNTTVTWTVTDVADVVETCTTVVTVIDNEAPSVTCQNITIQLDANGGSSLTPDQVVDSSSDACGIVSYDWDLTEINCDLLGTQSIMISALDAAGNVGQCSATLTVVDATAPVAICQDITVELDETGQGTITADDIDNMSSDACGIDNIVLSDYNFDCNDNITNTVTMTVTDVYGNPSMCNATVTIQDNLPPDISCPGDITLNNDAGECFATLIYTEPVGTDNCSGTTSIITSGWGSGGTPPIGIHEVVWTATDAAGNQSTCSFKVTVNDTEAPVPDDTSGPESGWEEASKALASDGASGDQFGYSVSISGDRAIVGSYRDYDNGIPSGSAYIYDWDGSSWIQQSKITASDGAANDEFGQSVSISGDRAIVGSYRDYDNGIPSGSAYIYDWDGSSWIESKLTASDGASNDRFGWSVSISGDRAIVGAFLDDDNGGNSGSAYIYDWDGSSWIESKLTASDGATNDQFGRSVSVSGDRAIVGASYDTDNGIFSGSAYLYDWDGSSWIEQSKITASDGAAYDQFGTSVSISGDRAIVGSFDVDGNGISSGSAYIYDWDGTSWIEQSKLTASDGAGNDYFGWSVSVSGDRAIVGSYLDDDNGGNSGSAYIYDWNGSNWVESKLTASDGAANDYFGTSVSISGDRAIVGSYLDDDNGNNSGSAYFFVLGVANLPDATAECSITPATPTATDNCGGTINGTTTTTFPITTQGTTVVTWTYDDGNGNISTQDQNIIIDDVTPPEITCIADGSRDTDSDACTYTVVGTEFDATFIDNCTDGSLSYNINGMGSVSSSTLAGVVLSIGANNIVWTVDDGNGQMATCEQQVTVEDNEAPIIEPGLGVTFPAPADILANVPESAGYDLVYQDVVNGGWNSNNYDVNNASALLGSSFERVAYYLELESATFGSQWIWVSMDDFTGNTVNQTGFPIGYLHDKLVNNMNVESNVAGIVTGTGITTGNVEMWPSNYADGANGPAIGGASTYDFDDSGFNTGTGYGSMQVHNYGEGQTLFAINRYRFTDEELGIGNSNTSHPDWTFSYNGNSYTTKNFYVLVGYYNEVLTDVDACEGTVPDLTGLVDASDNCGAITVTQSPEADTKFGSAHGDTQLITFTVADASGNESTTTTTLILSDNQIPTITCPEDVTVNTDQNSCLATSVNIGSPTAMDNCGFTESVDAPVAFPIGNTIVTWTVTDDSGNTATCEQTVTVIDNQPPIANCNDITIDLPNRDDYVLSTSDIDAIAAGSSDNCDLTYEITAGQTTYNCNDKGLSFAVTLTVTDAYDNHASCTAIVHIIDSESVCNDPPVAVCQDITIQVDGNCEATITANDIDGGSSDPDGDELTYSIDNAGPFGVGAHTVVLSVSDGEYTETCTATVTVEDDIAPTLVCENAEELLSNGDFEDVVTPSNFPDNGVDFAVWDEFGVVYEDAFPDRLAAKLFGGGVSGVTQDVAVVEGDWLCMDAQAITLSSDNIVGTSITGEVKIEFYDAAGEIINGPFGTVLDDFNGSTPAIADTWTYVGGCIETPANAVTARAIVIFLNFDLLPGSIIWDDVSMRRLTPMTFDTDLDQCTANITLDSPVQSDNCGIATIENDYNNGSDASDNYPKGTTLVTWTAVDLSGNTSKCNQLIVVEDTQNPSIVAQGDIIINTTLDDQGDCTFTLDVGVPSYGDNCPVINHTWEMTGAVEDSDDGYVVGEYTFPMGITTITYTAIDGAGNSTSDIMTVTVTSPIPDYYSIDATTNTPKSLAGGEVMVSVTQSVSGDLGAPIDVQSGYYLSIDDSFDAGLDILLANDISSLGAATDMELEDATLVIPADTELGDYYILIVSDDNDTQAECIEDNNMVAIPLSVVLTDYYGVNGEISATTLAPGESFIANSDQTADLLLNNVTLYSGYYLSVDMDFDGSDILLGTEFSTLSATDLYDYESASLTIPAGTIEGEYYLLIVTDPNDLIEEQNEDNNTIALAISVTTSVDQYDDFYIQGEELDKATAAPGEEVKATCYQWYDGTATTNYTVQLGYYFSTDNVFDAGDELMGTDNSTISLSDLNDKEYDYFNIPSGAPIGTAYIFFVTDYDESFGESEEGNNVEMVAIEIGAPLPTENDFSISSAAVDNTNPNAGTAITMSFDSDYTGNSSSTLTVGCRYYLSTDMVYDAGDIYLGAETSTLSANDVSDPEYKTSTIPSSTTDGDYYILFITDFNDDFPETDEDNNLVAVAITVGEIIPMINLDTPVEMSDESVEQNDIKFSEVTSSYIDHTDIKLYPNPTTNIINIRFSKDLAADQLLILSSAGHLVYSRSITTENMNESIDVTRLTNGVYHVVVIDSKSKTKSTTKFIKI